MNIFQLIFIGGGENIAAIKFIRRYDCQVLIKHSYRSRSKG
jgi:hypothetical protein